MKYVLILWVCSFIEGNGCLPPVESEKVFDTWYECSRAAHKESINLIKAQPPGYVDENGIYVKFYCDKII